MQAHTLPTYLRVLSLSLSLVFAAKWADTAVAAATPEDCCEACSLYSYCGVGA